MAIARKNLIDINVTRFYHCISTCVRQAMLCGKGHEHRKQWIEDRLQDLANAFAIGVCDFSVMDNHLHVMVRLEPERAKDWSVEEVVRRWMVVYPPSKVDLNDPEAVQAYIDEELKDTEKVEKSRKRLQSLSWFMKTLKEPLARMANKEDKCRGAFWAARFKSVAVLDEEALLATSAYIDLNPVAAGIAEFPETSAHTSIRQRVIHIHSQKDGMEILETAQEATAAARTELGKLEETHWLCPIQDRRSEGSERGGLSERVSLASYLKLVDYTSRLLRPGKARVDPEVESILERIGSSAEVWGQRIQQMFSNDRLYGCYFATDRSRLRELAEQRGVQRVANLAGCRA